MMMSIIIIINHGLDLIYFGLLVVANQFISVEVFWLILDIGTELSKEEKLLLQGLKIQPQNSYPRK